MIADFQKRKTSWAGLLAVFGTGALLYLVPPSFGQAPAPASTPNQAIVTDLTPLMRQTEAEAEAKSRGCVSCHIGIEPMHDSPAVKLGCTDCHGGNSGNAVAPGLQPDSSDYLSAKNASHVQPRNPKVWSVDGKRSARNPERSYAKLNEESPEFVKFINPGDLRIAQEACGGCHQKQVNNVPKSTMATASVFWAAASYANGILGEKNGILGESYTRDGKPQAIIPRRPPTPAEEKMGARPFLLPLPRWEVVQPGEYFRAFERGGLSTGSNVPEIGNPELLEDAGRPDIRLSNRGRGTGLRISPAVINLHKTRLNDPHLFFLGTNEHPGDYRSSGCSACHVVYANDRDRLHSGPYAAFGNTGKSFTDDVTIPKDEKGHPIRHRLTRAVPTSQCMSCHMHQPNSFVNTYLGYIMWDYESDAEFMFPKTQKYPTEAEKRAALDRNPEGAAVRGNWSDINFLENVSDLNPQLQHTQFADYHGHGWIFQAVFKRDRKGNLLDAEDKIVPFEDPQKFKKAVHLRDIHLERGMHCADCHFSADEHGNGTIYAEYGNTIEIECQDCHGDVNKYTNLRTSGPAAPPGGTDLKAAVTPFGQRRFVWRSGKLYQRSTVEKGMEWEVDQVKDSVTPGHPKYSEKSAYAKTVRADGSWGDVTGDEKALAHDDSEITCYACHSSWITGCFGCHLPQEANVKSEMIRYDGTTTRNYASYNPQVIRTDVYMLGVNGTTKGHKIAPVRSSSALILSSTNALRQRFYMQQAPISAPGYSSQAFNPHVPHTVRTRETKGCNDCHISEANDNNAWMAQLLTLGTNYVNFVGRFAYVGLGKKGFEAVAVTEWDEPQAVIGSYLHKVVYPDFYAKHQKKKKELAVSHHHHGQAERLEKRGEYVFAALGHHGFEVFDVANVDNKDFSERLVTAPVSPLGQRTFVRTKYATGIALPTNMPISPNRKLAPDLVARNQEQPFHPIYNYAFVSDKYEGVVAVDVATLTDGDPENNFFRNPMKFNPNGALDGAENLTVAGNYVYVLCKKGLVVIDYDTPADPKIVATLEDIHEGTSISVQFRYAFITDHKGLAVVDVTDPKSPRLAARVEIKEARSVYVARTYAYIAAGHEGIVIVDVEKPELPKIDQVYNADGELHDVHDVKVASTNANAYAYVADGEHGLKVLQLTSPDTTPGYSGFSPRPKPKLIAKRHTHGPALAIAKGLDRDRSVDESGNQVSIFNRVGARPMNFEEMRRLYLKNGKVFKVPSAPPRRSAAQKSGDARAGLNR